MKLIIWEGKSIVRWPSGVENSGKGIKMVVGSNQVGALRHMCIYIYIESNQMRELTCLEGTSYKDGWNLH